jgi:hypothetical protein
VKVQARIGGRQREQRLLDRRVGRLAIGEHAPRHERPLVLLGRRLREAGAQQRLVRERPLEAHPVERALRLVESGRLEEERAQHEVRLVANREARVVRRGELARRVELPDRLVGVPLLEEGDAEVVRDESREARVALERLEDGHGLGRLAHREVHVRAQELDVVPDRVGYFPLDPRERLHRIVELALLEVDLREPVRRLVADGLVDGAFENRLDRAARAQMHPVVELEVADGELGLPDVVGQRVEAGLVEPVVHRELGVQALERVEEVSLVGVVERLAEVEVPELGAHAGLRRETRGHPHSQQTSPRSHGITTPRARWARTRKAPRASSPRAWA